MDQANKPVTLENQIGTVMPDGFSFYELGTVIRDESTLAGSEEFPDTCMGVAFSIFPMSDGEPQSGLRTLLLAMFEEGLDPQIYTEIGNIIASRFAGGLSKILSEEIMITPPLTLQPAAVQRLTRLKKQMISRKRYFHSYENKMIPIEILVLRVEGNSHGNA